MALESRHDQRDPNALPIAAQLQVVTPAPAPAGNLPPEYTVPNEAPVMTTPLVTPTDMVNDTFPDVNPAKDTLSLPFKYDEAENLDEVYKYLLSTYGEHYVGKNNVQIQDLVLAGKPDETLGFWRWNSVKYILRYGKKGGFNRKDLLKAIHYAILMLYWDKQHGEKNGDT